MHASRVGTLGHLLLKQPRSGARAMLSGRGRWSGNVDCHAAIVGVLPHAHLHCPLRGLHTVDRAALRTAFSVDSVDASSGHMEHRFAAP